MESSTAAGEAARAQANSFNLKARDETGRPRGAPCPIRDSGARHDPLRSLFVRLHDSMLLCETTTEDFDEAHLRATLEREQIYADVSTKMAPDDFERDLRKLHLAAECVTCDARPRCGGCWQAQPENVFAEDRRRVEAVLEGLRGRILDVGCGSAAYLRVLEGSARRGDVEYVGLEPDPDRLAVLRSRYPWASYRASRIEDALSLEHDGRAFRHLLMLRSYNHLAQPDATLKALWSLVEPGGTVLIVDNVVFGLVRRAEHASRAEVGPARFEHFRNEDSTTLHERMVAAGWRLLERRDVGPRGSNEWLLRYQKPGGAS